MPKLSMKNAGGVRGMIDGAELRQFAGRFATGITVITTHDIAGRYFGLTMNAISCVSLTPPTFLICVDQKANSLAPMLESGVFAINILAWDQQDISDVFATKGDNKFRKLSYSLGLLDVPLIADALASAEFRVVQTYPAGDHVIILGEAQSTRIAENNPLLYYHGRYGLVHQPEDAGVEESNGTAR
jgi:flavin reductase (DIM6/NTAB) family NADH-FMN oxidoreductase RutF